MSVETKLEQYASLVNETIRAIRTDPTYTQDFADAAVIILRRQATKQAKQELSPRDTDASAV